MGDRNKMEAEVNAVQFDGDESSDADMEADYASLGFNIHEQYDIAVARAPTSTSRGMQVRAQSRHPLSKKTLLVLLDTGCNKSTVAKEVVSWYVPKERGRYWNAAGDVKRLVEVLIFL
ncbi:hypothetical protein GN244_ATG15553 [Phytophthora infestans]|uniref:Uncharacterized protein n=1 Tax=Phytophthora infestans TaxID=4787 RepID=A0A833W4V8_PHYIN|nr:hypothetical protein GN244_ATG19654 [Phytophthora infestans]KAF4032621.1 hypothetical protein GN244_ATG15553 [Phytophthora infestans]KAF4142376.1 hypothetical protein GN958_ATG08552 [Phytophthora infestans]